MYNNHRIKTESKQKLNCVSTYNPLFDPERIVAHEMKTKVKK